MRKVGNAEIIPILYEDKESWLTFRNRGIGGSEVATILGLDPYNNPARLYHQKIGLLSFPDFDNEPMFWGRKLEEVIANVYQYWWDGKYFDNFQQGKKIRSCRKINGYGVNPDYPHLFASLDRYLPKGTMSIDGEVLNKGGILEVKTISEYESSKWQHGIPEKYVLQVHLYMMVFGFDYSEIVYLMGGNKLRVVPIHFDQEIADSILYNSYKFWYDRVVPAQELVKQYHQHVQAGEKAAAEKVMWEIDHLEPNPSGGKSYRELMNQKYDNYTFDYHPADDKAKELAKKHKVLKEIVKALGDEVLAVENELVNIHDKNKAEYVRFGDDEGYARFYMRKGGVNPTFDNRIKVEIDKDNITEKVKKLLQ